MVEWHMTVDAAPVAPEKTTRSRSATKRRSAPRRRKAGPSAGDTDATRRVRSAVALPYMTSPGTLTKILAKIQAASTPDRLTQDYLRDTLGFRGGSAMQFLPLAKRVGLLGDDGRPTDLYRSFRNPEESHGAMLRALQHGYAPLFERRENAHQLDRTALQGLVMEATGLAKDSAVVPAILGTFSALQKLAAGAVPDAPPSGQQLEPALSPLAPRSTRSGSLQLGYTIFLSLPNTSDITVFNAIFRSLREHLLE
jgi:uncharacterized protein DUF5343